MLESAKASKFSRAIEFAACAYWVYACVALEL